VRTTIYKDDDFHLELEEYDVGLFIHFSVTKWSISQHRKAQELLAELMDQLKNRGIYDLYAAVHEDNLKLYKFCESFGFIEICCCNGTYIMNQEV